MLSGLLTAPAFAGGKTTTSQDVPSRRAATTTVIRTSTADTLVQVNVDIGMAVRAGTRCISSWTGACKGATYHPCFNREDPAYRGCYMYTLYDVVHPTRSDLARGISIANATTDAATGQTVTHDWARKITTAHLEVYASDPLKVYGDVRLRVDSFPHLAGDTASSDDIGHLNLPVAGSPGTGYIYGTAKGVDGQPMPPRSFKFDVFGHTNTGRRTGIDGKGAFTAYGFGRAAVAEGVTDGTFRTRPLYVGTYDVHVQRKGASYSCIVQVAEGGFRFDLDFGKPKLGHPGCRPMRPLATIPG